MSEHTCGYPTTRQGGSPCQQPVEHPQMRCPDHPKTLDEQLVQEEA